MRGIVKGGLNDGGNGIKSIQHGSITIASGAASGTLAVSAVVPANSLLIFDGYTSDTENTNAGLQLPTLALTNGTTVTASRVSGSSITLTVSFTLIEYNAGIVKSKQSGVSNATGTSVNIAISSVNTAKTILAYLGTSFSVGYETGNLSRANTKITLTNATTITATRGIALATSSTVGWNLIEFN